MYKYRCIYIYICKVCVCVYIYALKPHIDSNPHIASHTLAAQQTCAGFRGGVGRSHCPASPPAPGIDKQVIDKP